MRVVGAGRYRFVLRDAQLAALGVGIGNLGLVNPAVAVEQLHSVASAKAQHTHGVLAFLFRKLVGDSGGSEVGGEAGEHGVKFGHGTVF